MGFRVGLRVRIRIEGWVHGEGFDGLVLGSAACIFPAVLLIRRQATKIHEAQLFGSDSLTHIGGRRREGSTNVDFL